MKTLLSIVVLLISINSMAQSCVGRWVTIDDKTGKKKSVVKLYKKDSKLYGEIIYLFPREGRPDDAKCDKCTDDRKGDPLVGLQIVRTLTENELKGVLKLESTDSGTQANLRFPL